ncbi:hypothetical protein L7F22_008563 [Adiantum nelumboides]|nr:hypothetical protein [Adiantum nelumboides]
MEGQCGFFEWYDANTSTSQRLSKERGDNQNPLELSCSCKVGLSITLTAKTEKNMGRQFYKCSTSSNWWSSPWLDLRAVCFELQEHVETHAIDCQAKGSNQNEHDEDVAINELRHEIDSLLDHNKHAIVCSTVEVDGKHIFESTLVSQLNGNTQPCQRIGSRE